MLTSDDLFVENEPENLFESENVEKSHPQNNEYNEDEKENGDNDDDDDAQQKQVKIKRLRRPQPKLNEQTLRGRRGLSAINSHFASVKFKGKGHEARDLNTILKSYEYWCYRLFPKFVFEDSVSKLETLGNKRGVQTYVKRIRMGLDSDENEPENKIQTEDQSEDENAEIEAIDPIFDEIPQTTAVSDAPATAALQLSEDQAKLIELNRLRALKILEENKKRAEILNASNSPVSKQNETSEEKWAENEEQEIDHLLANINVENEGKEEENQVHLEGEEEGDFLTIEGLLDAVNGSDN